MLQNIINFIGFSGKIAIFGMILFVLIKSTLKHGKPKVTTYSFRETVILNILMVSIFGITGMFHDISIPMMIVLVIHLFDLIHSKIKDGYHHFTVYNAFFAYPVMLTYFGLLLWANFWSPVFNL